MKKNIAICLTGYFSNKDGDDLTKTNYIQENIINKIIQNHNLDIFIHSFDINNKSNILEKYPGVTSYIIEPQKDFNTVLDDENKACVEILNKYPDTIINTYYFSTLSLYYSRKKSIQLADEYARYNNKVYDCMLLLRFDTGIRFKRPFKDGHNDCCLVFDCDDIDKYINDGYIITPHFNQLNTGAADFWIISNHSDMLLIGNAYDYISNYALKPNSDYINALSNWPYSNKYHEFSNEILNPNYDPKNNANIPINCAMNSHCIDKYYFLITGLLFKIKYKRNCNPPIYIEDHMYDYIPGCPLNLHYL